MVKNTNYMLYMFYHNKKIIAREVGRKEESVALWRQGKESLQKEKVAKSVKKGE